MTDKQTETPKMNLNRLMGLALLGLCVLLAFTAKPRAHTPETLAAAYCKAALKDNERGVYKLLTPETRKLWDEALDRNAEIARAAPDEKPPLGDGVPIQAFPDRAPGCTPAAPSTRGDVTTIDVLHAFPDDPKADWTDRLLVQNTGKTWALADILFPPAGKYGLRRALEDAKNQ